MLIDPQERTIVSSLGWVDGGSLWALDVPTGREGSFRVGDAKYLSLHPGRSGHFAAVHHHDDDRVAITAHAFSEPGAILSRCFVSRDRRGIDGPVSPWEHLPRHYVAHLTQPSGSDFGLVSVSASEGVGVQTFEWYDSYDKMYQGILGVTEIPDSRQLLVSVQRSSTLVVYDPATNRKVGEVTLSNRHGNPSSYFRREAAELWAVDYDTLLKLEPGSWRILAARRLQDAAAGTTQFIGEFAFDADESICAVARPFSGDVIGLDPRTLRTEYQCQLGRQPLEVGLLRDRRVFARDWKSGDLLRGTLEPSIDELGRPGN